MHVDQRNNDSKIEMENHLVGGYPLGPTLQTPATPASHHPSTVDVAASETVELAGQLTP